MKALAWMGKKDVQVIEAPRPLVTDPGDVVLKITATTICGSDLHLYSGVMPDMHKGDILGHEFMGIVEDVGPEVKNIHQGQRVVVAFDIACGACDYCKRQEYTACDTTNPSKLMEEMYGHRCAGFYGYSHLTGGFPGGQAQYVRVPFADVNCLVVPDNLPDEKVLYLSDVIPTAFHGTELANVQPGSTVGIWGLGPIGLMTARWCQIRGAKKIIGIDRVPERLAVAKNYLKIDTIDFSQEKVLDRINEMVPGGVDCAIECAGYEYPKTILHKVEQALNLETDTADILAEMIYATRKFGYIGIIGVYAGFTNHFPIGAMMEKGLHVSGSQSPTQKYWKMCLEKIQSGEVEPFFLTHKGTLLDAPEFYKMFRERVNGVIKVFMRPFQM